MSVCKRCGDITTLSMQPIRVENKGLCELCIKDFNDLVEKLDNDRAIRFDEWANQIKGKQ